jgi:hypothetical protein
MFARRALRNLGGSYIVSTDATRQLPPTSSDIPAHSGTPPCALSTAWASTQVEGLALDPLFGETAGMGWPEVEYTRSGDVSIAYQVVGNGPIDVVFVPYLISTVFSWQHPLFVTFYERLASFSRLILLDKRGTGASDRPRTPPTLEAQMDDVGAVLDAVGGLVCRVRTKNTAGGFAECARNGGGTSFKTEASGRPTHRWPTTSPSFAP